MKLNGTQMHFTTAENTVKENILRRLVSIAEGVGVVATFLVLAAISTKFVLYAIKIR